MTVKILPMFGSHSVESYVGLTMSRRVVQKARQAAVVLLRARSCVAPRGTSRADEAAPSESIICHSEDRLKAAQRLQAIYPLIFGFF